MASELKHGEKLVPELMTGNEAVARAALDAGLTFFAGYPITPSSEIAETLAVELPKKGGVCIQMEDEISSVGAIIGAALGGARTMTATSGPGFSLKQEGIGYACEAEVPCVIVNVMRGGPSTGMPTLPAQGDVMQARWGTHGDHPMVAIYPERVIEAYELTLKAFDIADRLRTPVTLLLDEIIGHVTEKVLLPDSPLARKPLNRATELKPGEYKPYSFKGSLPPPLVPFGTGYRYHVTGLMHLEDGFPTNDADEADKLIRFLHRKVDDNRDMLVDVEVSGIPAAGSPEPDADVMVFAYGACSRSAKAALALAREKGLRVGLFRPHTIWPFPDAELRSAASRAKAILVAEMNLGQLTHEVEWALGRERKVHSLQKVGGDPIMPEEILKAIEEVRP